MFLGFPRLLAPARHVLFTVARFPSPPPTLVVQVVVDSFKDAARRGTPSSCSLRAFFCKFSCRSLSCSGTSPSSSLPNPSFKACSSDRFETRSPELVSSSLVAFVGVSIARASMSSEAWEAFERPCHRHFEKQVGSVANVNS